MSGNSNVKPEMQTLLDAQAAAYVGASIQEERVSWERYAKQVGQPCPPDIAQTDVDVPTPDGTVAVRLYEPAGQAAKPCVIYMHGGGWAKGGLDSSETLAWGLAERTGAIVASVDYRLAPEHPYPAAFTDCRAVLGWAHGEGAGHNIDGSRLALAGDSAGGCLSAALCLESRDAGGPQLRAQVIIYPGMAEIYDSVSYADCAEGYGLTTEKYRFYVRQYLSDRDRSEDARAQPLRASNFSNLPPALVVTAEFDPIRDDGRRYACKLIEAGNDCIYREGRGLIHGFFRARSISADVNRELDYAATFLARHLE